MLTSGVRNFSVRYLVLIYLGWWLIWMILQTLVLYNAELLPLDVAIKDAAITSVILALAGYIMIMSMRYYRPRQLSQLTWSIALAIGCVFLIRWTAILLLGEESDYAIFFEKSMVLRGLFSWLMISIVTVITWVYFYLQEQQEIENRKVNTEKLAREAELSSLRQQLQPHFLFNSLNSISALVGTKPEEARKMIQQLSDFLRGTIKKDDQQLVSLEEELKHLHLYLEIEKVRFGHRLRTEIEQQDETKKMVLPSLLLQPLVENAIKFGLYDTIGEITIRLQATVLDNYLHVRVQNPFDPETAQPKPGTGFGLNSIQRRLYLLYGRNDLISTHQNVNIFTTELKIPQPA
ncbi:histidine kinase [Chryseolinea sp. H1M3-3]|uniref:sensor histidine kinase n=1 Tax=Chryseolinea sp. H1M3-3 TaxID=3034144 RepID=UPI0023ECCDD0|nr:histidine kinase [Chryseolinea sp. H1M3-3]